MIRESPPVRLLLRASWTLGGPRLDDLLSGRRLRVLMYHGVPHEDRRGGVVNFYGYNVPADSFEAQVEYLSRRCNVVSLGDVLEGRLADRRTNVLVTFDDGYENNATAAFPVLERFEMPALFALPTAFVCDGEPLWNDVIEATVAATTRERVHLEWDGEAATFELVGDPERVELLLWLMRRAALTEPERRRDLIALAIDELGVELEAQSLFEEPDYRPLDGSQIAAMVASGLAEFASHSVRHLMMARLPRDTKRSELAESKAAIERLTGRACRAFCVPGGSYDEELLEVAGDLGFEAVLTSDWGWADPQAPTLDRCGIFASYDAARFADEVHGPVVRSLVALRRLLRGS